MYVIGEIFSGGKHPLEPLSAGAGGRFTRPMPRRNLFIPSTLVQGPDPLLDLRVADYQKPPALHISTARGTDARLKDLADQFVRNRVWLQPPHRPSGSDKVEQIGGVRGCLG
jgi:hypothetical protein